MENLGDAAEISIDYFGPAEEEYTRENILDNIYRSKLPCYLFALLINCLHWKQFMNNANRYFFVSTLCCETYYVESKLWKV